MSIFFNRLTGIEETIAMFILRKLELLTEVLVGYNGDEETAFDVDVRRTTNLDDKYGTEEHGVYRVTVGKNTFNEEDFEWVLAQQHYALVLVQNSEIIEHRFLTNEEDFRYEDHFVDELYLRPIVEHIESTGIRSGGSVPAPVSAFMGRRRREIDDEVSAQHAKREANRRNRQAARRALSQTSDWDDMVIEARRSDRVS